MPDGYSRSPMEIWQDNIILRWHTYILITCAISLGDYREYLRAQLLQSLALWVRRCGPELN